MGVQISGDTGNVLATKGTYTGNLTVGGVLTYEDVTNVDSVGLVTARSGIEIGARPGVAASISVDGNMIVSGIATIGSKLGIGGITPSNALDVQAGTTNTAIVARSTDTKAQISLVDNSTTSVGSVVVGAVGDALFFTSGSGGAERARIDSDGHFGIGMSPSGVRLDVTSTVNDIARFSGANSGGITIRNDTTNEIQIHSGTSDALIFGTNGENERLRIYANGAVLIGAKAGEAGGDAKLAIDCQGMNIYDGVGDASNYGLIFANDSTTDKANGIGFFNDSASTCGGYIVHQDKGGGNIGDLVFGTSASSDTPVERVRITSDGKLGINISTPGTLVHQHESSSGANYHKFTNSTTGSEGTDGAYVGLDGNEQFIMWTQETGKLRFAVADSERVYINNDGHLGINDGNLVIGTSGHGIDFSATSDSGGSMSNELLDDYEEGTFTPSLLNVSTPNYEAIGGTYRI